MEKKSLQIQETKSNFEAFRYIINTIIDEIFDNNQNKSKFELEKDILSLINHWYETIEENNKSREVFSEKKLSDYIMQDKKLASQFYLIATEGISQDLLKYLQDFNVSKLDKQPKRFDLMWNSINKIQQAISRNIQPKPLSVSEYIDKINEELLYEFMPEKLESRFKLFWLQQKSINNINLWREKTNINDVRLYIDKRFLLPKSIKDYKNNVFQIIRNNTLQSWIFFIYITKEKTIWYTIKDPNGEYFQQDVKQLEEKNEKVFILRKPKY